MEQLQLCRHLVGLPALQGLLGEGLLSLGERQLSAAVPLVRGALGLVVLVLELLLGGDDLMGHSSREAGGRGGVGGDSYEGRRLGGKVWKERRGKRAERAVLEAH